MAASGTVESEANVTDIHEALHFDIMDEGSDDGFQRGFGIWSLSWAANGQEVVAGTGDDSLYLYNMERQKVSFPARKGFTYRNRGNTSSEGCAQKHVYVHNIRDCRLLMVLPGNKSSGI